jgi:uncharacterized membrane protein
MQSNCPPNQIQMSEPTALMLMSVSRYKLTKRGIVRVKGKGDVNTYWSVWIYFTYIHFSRLNEHSDDASPKGHKEELSALPPLISSRVDSQLLGSMTNRMEKDDSTETPPDPGKFNARI